MSFKIPLNPYIVLMWIKGFYSWFTSISSWLSSLSGPFTIPFFTPLPFSLRCRSCSASPKLGYVTHSEGARWSHIRLGKAYICGIWHCALAEAKNVFLALVFLVLTSSILTFLTLLFLTLVSSLIRRFSKSLRPTGDNPTLLSHCLLLIDAATTRPGSLTADPHSPKRLMCTRGCHHFQ